MNPARSIGPAVMTGHLENLWPYIAGPLLGGVLAVVVATVLRGSYRAAPVPSDAGDERRPGLNRNWNETHDPLALATVTTHAPGQTKSQRSQGG